MASSYSTDLKLELMVTGEKAGQWGDITNTNLNLLQQAIAGYQEVNIAGSAQTTTLVMSDAALSNARNAVIKLTGTITGNQIVTVPTGIEKTYIVENGTTGAFTVEFKQAGGTGTITGNQIVELPTGIEKTYIVENGTTGAFTVQFKQAGGTGPTFSTTDKGIKILYANATNVIDVNSKLNTISLFTLPTADGTNGQAIVTNGSGTLSFATAGITTGKAIAMAIVFG